MGLLFYFLERNSPNHIFILRDALVLAIRLTSGRPGSQTNAPEPMGAARYGLAMTPISGTPPRPLAMCNILRNNQGTQDGRCTPTTVGFEFLPGDRTLRAIPTMQRGR